VGLGWARTLTSRGNGNETLRLSLLREARGTSNLALGFPAPDKRAAHERGRNAGRKRASFMSPKRGERVPFRGTTRASDRHARGVSHCRAACRTSLSPTAAARHR
jgi:hypothetical protein